MDKLGGGIVLCLLCYYFIGVYIVQASLVSVGCAGCLDQSGLSIQSGQQIINAPYCVRCIVLDGLF